jgi:Alw26I/Eco31I/Esp3I family type II restriction m6 adenine DNA methyltransferase
MHTHRNSSLFSNHYLDNILLGENEWKIDIEPVFKKIKTLYDSNKSELPALNESQLRKHFLDKVFEILGFTVDVEPPAIGEEWTKKPDYALFRNDDVLKSARKKLKAGGYFNAALCIAEAKRWGRPFDRQLKTESDPFEIQNPSLQMSRYLWLTGVEWGILTDGKFWRLYERETSKRLDIYYEIDLEDLLLYGSLEDFKYFYLFFSIDAFPAFLDKVYKGSVDYAKEVGDELKENVYKALKSLSEGFLKTHGNRLSQENLKEIHDNSLILLYRLLFILYAEYRGLLPLNENTLYTDSYSLDSLKKETARKFDSNETIPVSTFHYWNKLKELFEIINIGNKELAVPPYNGGLFNPEKHPFLEKHRVGDFYIARAIDLLSRSSDRAYIDYGSLEIRHLGSIYEGLLEYKLKIAEEDLYPVKEKDKEIYIPLSKASINVKKVREDEIIKAGDICLITDKGERKATGSYYTPDYIVEYIVENTLVPIIEEKKKDIAKNISELKEKIKTSRGINREIYQKELQKVENSLIDELLSIKILDPAMGSGHFLVEATDFLAHELIKVMSGDSELTEVSGVKEDVADYGQKEVEEDIRWARREVVEKCIFGVDVNPLAVELAKLSLWLHTVAKNRPLNFLDHHLRCGNSLIGARIEDLAGLPELKKKKATEGAPKQLGLFESIFKEKVNILLGAFSQIEGLPSDTVEQIREKEKLYQDFRRIVSRFQDVADIWTSVYFGNGIDFGKYQSLQDNLRANDEMWEDLRNEQWFKKSKAIADEKRFFHWELEFPEIFFEGHRRKENPGFDCVIGNPPYDVLSELEQGRNVDYEKEFFSQQTFYRPAIGSKINFYRLFSAISLNLLKSKGMHGFIVPMALLADKQAKPLREFILRKNCLQKIEAFPQTDDPFNRVFFEAKLPTCIYILSKQKPFLFDIRIHPGRDILDSSTHLTIKPSQIEEFDKENLSIPSYPTMTIKDFNLALKLNRVSNGVILKHFVSSQQGEVNLTSHSEYLTDEEKGQIVLRGAHINRYEFQEEPKQGTPMYLDVKSFLETHGKDTKAYDHKYIRIGYQRGAAIDNWRRIIATIIEKDNFCSDTINYIVKPKEYNLFAILALLNSSLWEWRFRLTSTNNHVNSYEIDSMPMPPISFITPSMERKEFAEEAIELYDDSKYEDILKWAEHELALKRNDTIHDFLVFLAEQMIELNKAQTEEIKGFLKWLEREIGAEIDILTNKTAIKEYYEHSFEHFLDVLKKNKGKISIDPSNRKTQELLEKHFTKSVSVLEPLKEKIKATDDLIDQIVYKLYGLTDEEIEIVEGRK